MLYTRNLVAVICAFCLLAIGTAHNASAESASTGFSAQTLIIDGRESEELWLNTTQGRFRFTAEIADEEAERATGLMFREEMAPDHGMLFDFGEKRRIQMWMRNTPRSLDMVFLDEAGEVKGIRERTTPFSEAIIDSGEPITHVLEVNAGVSRLIGLKPGDTIEHRLFQKD